MVAPEPRASSIPNNKRLAWRCVDQISANAEDFLKILKIFLFCGVCLLALLTAAAASCAFRVRYGNLARLNTSMAYSYASLFGDYSLLQYNQAGGEQGKKALLDYLEILQKMRDQGIRDPKNVLTSISQYPTFAFIDWRWLQPIPSRRKNI